MGTRMEARDVFVKQFKGFLKDLIRVFPDDREIRLVSSTLNVALLDDLEDKIIQGYYETLLPYQDLVQARNPELFYKNLDSFTKKWNVGLFSKMSQYWEGLTEENRKIMWDYIDVLYRLATLVQKARTN